MHPAQKNASYICLLLLQTHLLTRESISASATTTIATCDDLRIGPAVYVL